MGFLDPLFIRVLMSVFGLIGITIAGVPTQWVTGEVVYLTGAVFLLKRDWSKFQNEKYFAAIEKGEIKLEKYQIWYMLLIFFSIVSGILLIANGLQGDNRLSTSPIRKIIDIVSSILIIGNTLPWSLSTSTINSSIIKNTLIIGMTFPILFSPSKAGGIYTILWAFQRWINTDSRFSIIQKLFKKRLSLRSVLILTLSFFAPIIPIITYYSQSGDIVATISERLYSEWDFYIFLEKISEKDYSYLTEKTGGFFGAFFGNFANFGSSTIYNVGSLVKSIALNIQVDETGSNPRLIPIIYIFNSLSLDNQWLGFFIAVVELFFLSELRKRYVKRFEIGKKYIESMTYFMIFTYSIDRIHIDLSSAKYCILAILAGRILLGVRL